MNYKINNRLWFASACMLVLIFINFAIQKKNQSHFFSTQEKQVIAKLEGHARVCSAKKTRGSTIRLRDVTKLNTGSATQRLSTIILIHHIFGDNAGYHHFQRLIDNWDEVQNQDLEPGFQLTNREIVFKTLLNKLYQKGPSEFHKQLMTVNITEQRFIDELGYLGKLMYAKNDEISKNDVVTSQKYAADKVSTYFHIGFLFLTFLTTLYTLVYARTSSYIKTEATMRKTAAYYQKKGAYYMEIFSFCSIVTILVSGLVGEKLLGNILVIFVLINIILIYSLSYKEVGSVWSQIGFRKPMAKGINLPKDYVLFVALITLIGYGGQALYPLIFESQSQPYDILLLANQFDLYTVYTGSNTLIAIATIVATSAYLSVLLELLYRGLLLFGVSRISVVFFKVSTGLIFSTVVTGLVFAMIFHQGAEAFIFLFTSSTIMCFLRFRFNSLLPSIAFHTVILSGVLICSYLMKV